MIGSVEQWGHGERRRGSDRREIERKIGEIDFGDAENWSMNVGASGHETVGELAGLLVGVFGGLFFDRIKAHFGHSGNMWLLESYLLHRSSDTATRDSNTSQRRS